MGDIDIRIAGRAGRITLTRPQALNALSHAMCLGIDAALRAWRDDETVDLVVIDAQGDKAFCAGGDIAELYASGKRGDFAYGRRFWRDEYRLNAALSEYPKPVVSFMQGFVMGGGVGIGCHVSHRVVEDSTRIAMPECGIGLVPDVGGSYLLARAPGRTGEYLGLTGARMDAGYAIFAGFADCYLPRAGWGDLIGRLERSGDVSYVTKAGAAPPVPPVGARHPPGDEIARFFTSDSLADIIENLRAEPSEFARNALKSINRNSPLSMSCTLKLLQIQRADALNIRTALGLEYRFTWRAMRDGDFLEGIRAQIIDKDRNPIWKYRDVPASVVAAMLAPLGAEALTFETGE